MQPWMANLLGLAIGFAIGGAALVHFLPQLEAYRAAAPPPAAQVAEAVPPPQAAPPPAPMPQIVEPDMPHWQPVVNRPALPQIIEPAPQGKTAGIAGTGFFIAHDGTLLTAAHVVAACKRIQVISRLVKLTAAHILATDPKADIALLRADHTNVPAILPIGMPAARAGRLFVLGFPATATRTEPEETWATLENARLPRDAGTYADPGFLVWLESSAVTHGYSGGPILDPRDGAVVGIVKGSVDPRNLRRMPGMPEGGIDIGPGSARLIQFVQQQEPGMDVTQSWAEGDEAVSLARRATVHVFCWQL